MKKNIKRCALIIIGWCCALGAVGFFVALSQNRNVADHQEAAITTVESGDRVYSVSSDALLTIDISDPEVVAGRSSNIALVRITSIDGSDNYSEVYGDYVYPYTYGHMTILENIKGELAVGESVMFYKLGGTLSVDRYYEGLTEGEKEKFDAIRNNNDTLRASGQIDIRVSDDITVETGKTYLVYLTPEISYYGEPNTYAITCFQGGIREARLQETDTRSHSDVKILNNFTGEWENLSDIVMSAQ